MPATIILRISRKNHTAWNVSIKKAAAIIRNGGTVAFPTETVYGLGANALDPRAVRKIFYAKGRPRDNPLIVHIGAVRQAYTLARDIPTPARALMKRFWPGPLTLVLPKKTGLPTSVTAGLRSVAVRMPSHPITLALLRAAKKPIAAPSANRSGRPSPTRAGDVLEDLDGRIDAVLDGGRTPIGIESTVVDCTTRIPTILRPGIITREQIEAIIGPVHAHADSSADAHADAHTAHPHGRSTPRIPRQHPSRNVPRAPGMKYRHYAPRARVILFTGMPQKTEKTIRQHASVLRKQGKKTGVILTKGRRKTHNLTFCLGSQSRTIAKDIYQSLRSMDSLGVHIILIQGVEEQGAGIAIMNRLRKAASRIIHA